MGGRADLPSFDDLSPGGDAASSAGGDAGPDKGREVPDERTDRQEPSGRQARSDAAEDASPRVQPAGSEPASADDWAAGDVDVDRDQIAELLETFARGLRAHRLYQSNNQAYQRFLAAVRESFEGLWDRMSSLKLAVEDRALRWGEHHFAVGSGHDSLAFLFYKDGIRQVTFLPGFEDEVDRFFGVLARARTMNREEDDLVTLLWEQDFEFFHHVYVDILAEGVEMPSPDPPSDDPIDAALVAADVAAGDAGGGGGAGVLEGEAAAKAKVSTAISREDFEETMYFLDDAELRQLRAQVWEEWQRDVRSAAVDALFDRLEDPLPERRDEIFDILQHLLVGFLTSREYASVAQVLRQLDGLVDRELFSDEERARADAVFDALSEADLLRTLLESLQEGTVDPNSEALSQMFAHLRPSALPLLLRAVVEARRPGSRVQLEEVTVGLAERHPDALLDAMRADEPTLAEEAARTAGRLKVKDAVPRLRRLLKRGESPVRHAAVEALAAIRTGDAMKALERALTDSDRDVRLTAVRGIAELGYQPAHARLEKIIGSRSFRGADLTEKVAFFEAYGSLGSAADVDMLDRLLNERGLLRRRTQPDLRACAALALGRLGTPAAEAALQRASGESHPAVRRAITRARARATGDGAT